MACDTTLATSDDATQPSHETKALELSRMGHDMLNDLHQIRLAASIMVQSKQLEDVLDDEVMPHLTAKVALRDMIRRVDHIAGTLREYRQKAEQS